LPVSPGGEVDKSWWLQTDSPTLYPNQPKTTADTKPFIVPGGGIFVWPNGTINGPWLTKSTKKTTPKYASSVFASSTTTIRTHLSTPTRTSTKSTASTQPLKTTKIVTPVLVPATYMPVVSTYPPEESFGQMPSTVLPIYPYEIGQNVKFTPKSGEVVTHPTSSTEEGEITDEWMTKEYAETTTSMTGKIFLDKNSA
jgi:hypothetical protein